MLAELQPEWLRRALGVSVCPPAPEEPPSPVLSPSGFGDAPEETPALHLPKRNKVENRYFLV